MHENILIVEDLQYYLKNKEFSCNLPIELEEILKKELRLIISTIE